MAAIGIPQLQQQPPPPPPPPPPPASELDINGSPTNRLT
jgi:hypothetical protein